MHAMVYECLMPVKILIIIIANCVYKWSDTDASTNTESCSLYLGGKFMVDNQNLHESQTEGYI